MAYYASDYSAQVQDPNNPANVRRRLDQFGGYMQAHPGAAPGGTGDTGLTPGDATGWSGIQNKQIQYLRDLATANGSSQPNVRVAPYDGSEFSGSSGSDGGSPAPKGRSMASPAMNGLKTAMDGGGPSRAVLDDPDLYKAYKNSLLDTMQATGRNARMTALAPGDIAELNGDSRINDIEAGDREFERGQGDRDVMQTAASKYHAWDSYGKPQALDVNNMAGDLADRRGQAATLDDQVRVGGQLGVANINAGVQDRRTGATSSAAALAALQREVANQRQYGSAVDPNAQGALNARTGVGAPPAAAGAPVGAAGGGKPLPRAQYEATKQQNGWDDATAQQMARQHGYVVVD